MKRVGMILCPGLRMVLLALLLRDDGQFIKGRATQQLGQFHLGFGPDVVHRAIAVTWACARFDDAPVQTDGAVQSFDDLEQADL